MLTGNTPSENLGEQEEGQELQDLVTGSLPAQIQNTEQHQPSLDLEKLIHDEAFRKMVFELLKNLTDNAYAPYSNFRVSALLLILSPTGELLMIRGVNVENSSYGLSICAERNAVFRAITSGMHPDRGYRWLGMLIYTETDSFTLPCGACRQVMGEFNPNLKVVSFNTKGDYVVYDLEKLLPHQFRLKLDDK